MERIVNVSGGKDSTALYCLALERGKPFRAVFADTGHESPKTYDYVQSLPERTGGPPITVVKADYTERLKRRRATIRKKWSRKGVAESVIEKAIPLLHPTGVPFVDAALYNGIFPAPKQRYCTRELKTEPIEEQMYRPLIREGYHVVAWQGIRAEESVVRANSPVRQILRTKFEDHYHVLRPLLHWDLERVMAYIKRHGLKVNPLYGEGFSRVGCFPCIYASKHEIAELARRYPAQIERIEQWEALLKESGRSERTPSFFYAGKDTTWKKGEPTGIRRIAEWAQTKRGGKQFQLIPTISRAQEHMAEACSESGICE